MEHKKNGMRVVIAHDAPVRIWGLSNHDRVQRLVDKAGVEEADDAPTVLWIDARYAFDPLWLDHLLAQPGQVVSVKGKPVLAHVQVGDLSLVENGSVPSCAFHYKMEEKPELYNHSLRKSQHPFCERLTEKTVEDLERKSYYGAYKGVTDVLTKYLWPEIAYHLTRVAASLKMTPNMVTAIGAALCVLATWYFWIGAYWAGVAVGFVFMILDTVDGKLARCTITSSAWGNIFDHGIDLIHPPFWWFAWAMGLSSWGLAYEPVVFWSVQAVILSGYVAQRLIEGWFIIRYGCHIHVWRRFDSMFRLITARRNPNMILMVGALLFNRPDIGLILVAFWTIMSFFVHAVRGGQAEMRKRKGQAIRSWLEEG